MLVPKNFVQLRRSRFGGAGSARCCLPAGYLLPAAGRSLAGCGALGKGAAVGVYLGVSNFSQAGRKVSLFLWEEESKTSISGQF